MWSSSKANFNIFISFQSDHVPSLCKWPIGGDGKKSLASSLCVYGMIFEQELICHLGQNTCFVDNF